MPEPVKQPETPAPNPEAARDAALADGIAKGLAKELAPLLSRPGQSERREEPVAPQAPPLPKEPSYDEIADALEAGDKRKYAELMVQRDRAQRMRLERELVEPLREQGAAAINAMARESGQQLLSRLPAKYHEEVKQLIKDQVESKGIIATVDHWRKAVSMVYGDHGKEIEDERVETRLRQAREKPEGIEPGQGGKGDDEPEEPQTLHDAFPGKFVEAFTTKARAKGGLSEDSEVQAMNRGIKDGQLKDEKGRRIRDYTVKDYMKERREMRAYADENPSLGLDE